MFRLCLARVECVPVPVATCELPWSRGRTQWLRNFDGLRVASDGPLTLHAHAGGMSGPQLKLSAAATV